MENKNLVNVTAEYDGTTRTAEGEAMYGVVYSEVEGGFDASTFLMGVTSVQDLAIAISGSIMELDRTHEGLCSLVAERLLISSIFRLGEEEGR